MEEGRIIRNMWQNCCFAQEGEEEEEEEEEEEDEEEEFYLP